MAEERHGTILGGRVALAQPRRGYRVAIDPVLLAAAVPARARARVLELGLGTGAAALCLLARVSGAHVTGLEADADMAARAAANAALNAMSDRLQIVAGDVLRLPRGLVGFDHVMANPPHLSPARADPRRLGAAPGANIDRAGIEAWIAAARRALKDGGTLTLVHRADRVDEILAALRRGFGGIVLFPLWPRAGVAAKRVLIEARKASRGPATIAPGLVLHGPDGRLTPEAEAILRDGRALSIGSPRGAP
jgi:tRNA1(Val) A37 N6-methylase TrmN6